MNIPFNLLNYHTARSSMSCAVLCIALVCSHVSYSQLSRWRVAPDFSRKITKEVTIKEKSDKEYTAVIKNTFDNTYLSERSTRINIFNITESSVTELRDMDATFNKRGLSKERFSFKYPPAEDEFLSGTKIHSIFIPVTINRGDVFVYTYKEHFNDIAFLPMVYIQDTDSIARYEVIYRLPAELSIDFEIFFSRDSFPISILRNDNVVTITVQSLPEVSELNNYPHNGFHAAIIPRFRKNGIEISPTSAESFARWYSSKTALLPSFDSTDIIEARSYINTTGNELDRLRSISEYITKNVRYIADERGINAYIARNPSVTLKRKYGDCKDKAALAVALSKLNNTTVYMALVSTTTKPEFAGTHVYMYNHVICAYTLEGKTFFFDPTATYTEFGNIPEQLIGATALVLDPLHPRFEKISSPLNAPSLDIVINTHIDSLSAAKATIVLHNRYFSASRHSLKELTLERWRQYLQEIITSNLFQIQLKDFQYKGENEHWMAIDASATLSNFAVVSSPRVYLPQTPFTGSFNDVTSREQDSLPIYFTNEMRLRLQINITAPNCVIDTTQKMLLGNEGDPWIYQASLRHNGNIISLIYNFTNTQKKVPNEMKRRFIDFIKQYVAGRKHKFVITRTL